ncbi:MAG TPA: superoxide dismutase family protein [Bacilli bacterium]|nr:superoxide dismutase family protein [Bacilli bacterium]
MFLSGCQLTGEREGDTELEQEAVEVGAVVDEVIVTLINQEGRQVATATLSEQKTGGVKIKLEGDNLPPGVHGFHIHDRAVCVPPDFESAGAHYNPTNSKHGFDHSEGPHAGDLENITVSEDGTVFVEVEAPLVTLNPDGENTLFTDEGTTLVIHAEPDDYISQPAGNAGARIACGVIGE